MKIPACLLTMSQKLWRGSNPFWEILRLVHTPKKFQKKFPATTRLLRSSIYQNILVLYKSKEEWMLTSLGDDMKFSFLLQII